MNNLLLQTIQKFSKKELNQLQSFVQSPYFNSSEQLIHTLSYLLNCLKKDALPNKIDLYQQIFGKKQVFNDHKIRLLLSDLLKLVEEFIWHQEQQNDKINRQILLAKFYRKNGLDKHFNRVQRKADQLFEKTAYQNNTYYAAKNALEWERYKLNSSKKREIDTNLQELGQNLDVSYFSSKLRQACFLKAQQAVYSIEYDFEWVNQILEYVTKKNWAMIPAISLYFTAYQLADKPSEVQFFDNLKQQILDYGKLFPPEEIKDIYLLAINYCIKKVNNGQRSFAAESLKLYKKGLEIDCFLENGCLSKFTYANIVAFGLMAKDFAWTSDFIQNYQNKLEKNSRNSAYAFNMARLSYVQDKNHETALSFLQKVSDKDLLNTLNAKILQLRIYWEIKAYDVLESHLEAMANFIRRKEVIGYHKENYLNIIKFTKRLLKVNFYDKKEMEKLKINIEKEGTLSEKKWLLNQLSIM